MKEVSVLTISFCKFAKFFLLSPNKWIPSLSNSLFKSSANIWHSDESDESSEAFEVIVIRLPCSE
jgi:hypothetical protein